MPQAEIRAGRLVAPVVEGDLRGIRFDGHEVLRRVSYPVRDADWGTVPVVTLSENLSSRAYFRRFAEASGLFEGAFRVDMAGEGQLRLSVTFRFARAARINRAGFAVLHPLEGVADQPMQVRHPDGRVTDTSFPALISPGQPAQEIAGLSHRVGPVAVDLSFAGEVFEMEDQRNWSDASFKTYCRPLGAPRPFAVAAGETIGQEITLALASTGSGAAAALAETAGRGRLPAVGLAHEPGLSSTAALAAFPGVPVLFRLAATTPDGDLTALRSRTDVAVEIVFDDHADLDRQLARLRALGPAPLRLVALPRAYLASHQPSGPWPTGPAPRDALHPLRAAFPGVPVGSGSLTNFTEFNRCPPDPTADFATFGTTAIVHAADDQSVCETLEALPAIFASAKALLPGKPLHLGLFSIGMRSNPYGSAVVPNPDRLRVPMAMVDPRQATDFAAAHALGIVVAAAAAGVASLALAMPDGPLGAKGTPLGRVIRTLAAAAGKEIRWQASGGRLTLEGPGFAFDTDGTSLREAVP